MKDKLTRRSFITGCGVLTFSTAGIFFTGCGSSSSSDNDYKDNDYKDNDDKNGDEIQVEKSDKAITMSQSNLDILKSRGYVEQPSDNLLVFSFDDKFYGFSNICPHENGQLKIEDETTIRCQKHNIQTYDNNGIGNKAKTNRSLSLITLEVQVG